MTADNARLLVALLRAVARLALPASEQLTYLQSIGVDDLADELALELDDGMGLLPTFEEMGWLKPAEVGILRNLNRLLGEMSGRGPGKDDLWRTRGLTTDPRWDEVRRCARSFLTL